MTKTTYESQKRKMEEKKLKEIEAKLRQLLLQNDKSKKNQETVPSPIKFQGAGVIRRRKGHQDLHIN